MCFPGRQSETGIWRGPFYVNRTETLQPVFPQRPLLVCNSGVHSAAVGNWVKPKRRKSFHGDLLSSRKHILILTCERQLQLLKLTLSKLQECCAVQSLDSSLPGKYITFLGIIWGCGPAFSAVLWALNASSFYTSLQECISGCEAWSSAQVRESTARRASGRAMSPVRAGERGLRSCVSHAPGNLDFHDTKTVLL